MAQGMRGISPVIATVIILAVTIAIAITAVGWIMGIFKSTTHSTPNIALLPDNYLYNVTVTNASKKAVLIVVHVQNVGASKATVYKLEVEGVGSNTSLYECSTAPSSIDTSLKPGNCQGPKSGVTINPGNDTYIAAVLVGKSVAPGATYVVYVYAKGSTVPMSAQVNAEEITAK